MQMWADLMPDPSMVAALDEADRVRRRSEALAGGRAAKLKWSNAFADACARMVASRMRAQGVAAGLSVLPDEDGAAEPPTYIAGGDRKKVDVVVASRVSGLQLGISLKGMNFRDKSGLQFDKNLTGRTYELRDEVGLIHAYQPASFMAAVYFLPIAAVADKRKGGTAASSFARTVLHLNARTGRLDPSLPAHFDRPDLALVCLYVPGDTERIDGDVYYQDTLPRGIVRFHDVRGLPPRRGRPQIASTLSLDDAVALLRRESGVGDRRFEPQAWAPPEADD